MGGLEKKMDVSSHGTRDPYLYTDYKLPTQNDLSENLKKRGYLMFDDDAIMEDTLKNISNTFKKKSIVFNGSTIFIEENPDTSYQSYIESLLVFAYADNNFKDDEINVIQEIGEHDLCMEVQELRNLIYNYDNSSSIINIKVPSKNKLEWFSHVIAVIVADGKDDPEEVKLLSMLAKEIGLNDEALKFSLKAALKQRKGTLLEKYLNNKLNESREEIEVQTENINKLYRTLQNQLADIQASMRYSSTIQKSVLPKLGALERILGEHIIIAKPRNTVNGDFYRVGEYGKNTVFAAADCTGHGIPAALVGMLGIKSLHEILDKAKGDISPDLVLNDLRKVMKSTLQQTELTGRDGMDIALCVLNNETGVLSYAGAHRPLYIISKQDGVSSLVEYPPDKMPIGYFTSKEDKPFEAKILKPNKGDIAFLFSDGFFDEFKKGTGVKDAKSRFKSFLIELQQYPSLDQQKDYIMNSLNNWLGDSGQIDDILIMAKRF